MAWVQGIGASGGGDATTLVFTLGSAVGSGNLVVGGLTWYPLTTNITSIVDNQSNTYTSVITFNDTTDEQRIAVFARKNITNAPTTITVNFSANASFRAGAVDEFSAVEGTVVNSAGQVQSAPGTGTDAITSGNITGGASGDLVWGITLGTGGASTAPNPGTGFSTGTTNTPVVVIRTESKSLASAGTTAATYTQGSAALWSTAGVVFTASSTGENPAVPDAWDWVGVSTSVEVATTAHTLTMPAGVQEGDLLVAVISSRIASTTSITLPSAEWSLVTEQKANNVLTTTSAVASGMMAQCIRGASNPALTFTHPTAPSVALGRIVAYRGVHGGKPRDTQNSATTAINTTAVSVTGVTTTEPNTLIVVGACGGQEAAWSAFDATSPSVSSGTGADQTADPIVDTWQERCQQVTTTGADTSLAIADAVKATAGATGNITATASLGASHVVLIGAFNLIARENRPPLVSRWAINRAADW